jgi:hypothetical protein
MIERTNYMDKIIQQSWQSVMHLYLRTHNINTAWEEVISGRLALDFKNDVSEADVILQATDYDASAAARMVLAAAAGELISVKFDVEYQFKQYLERVDLSEDNMPHEQLRQLKTTFYAAFGVFMTLLMNDIQRLSQEEAERVVQFMLHQVGDFFTRSAGQLN